MKEKELITQCVHKDRAAQKQLYEQFARSMYRLCYRYLNDELAAEDAMINGFYKVFQMASSFTYRGEGSLKAWIKRIMVNESLMELRKHVVFSSIDGGHLDNAAGETYIPDDLETEEIYALVLQLPTGYRTVFNMYVVEGYTHKEISSKLNITEGTSKSQLSKAKAMLKNVLIRKGIEYGI